MRREWRKNNRRHYFYFQSGDRKKVQKKTQFVDTPWPRIWHKWCKSVCAPQGIYCAFQTEQPADREEAEEGDVRHSRIRRQGGRKAGLAREESSRLGAAPQVSNNWYGHLPKRRRGGWVWGGVTAVSSLALKQWSKGSISTKVLLQTWAPRLLV